MTTKMQFQLEIKQVTESGDFYMFEGLASTFGNEDLGGDIVQQGAFVDTIADKQREAKVIEGLTLDGAPARALLPVLWQHDQYEPVGSIVEMRETGNGLLVRGALPKGDVQVEGRVVPQMRAGSIKAMSIGYRPEVVDFSDGDARILVKIKLFEISLVTFPMNPQAQIASVKMAASDLGGFSVAPRDTPWNPVEADIRMRKHARADTAPTDDYRAAFLVERKDAPDKYLGVSLQILDVVDGEVMIVPRAVFAAAAAIGTKNELDFDRAGAIAVLEKLYARLQLDTPFDSKGALIRVDELDVINVTTCERHLRGLFGRGIAKKIATTISKAGLLCEATDSARREAVTEMGLGGIAKALDRISNIT